jgi:hypothetical protein
MSDAPQLPSFQVDWSRVSSMPVATANEFAVQVTRWAGSPEYTVVSVGHVASPIFVGTPEEQRIFLNESRVIQVAPVIRFSVTRTQLDVLISQLEEARQAYDAT